MSDSTRKEAELLAAAFFFAHDLFRSPSPEQWSHLIAKGTRQVWMTLADLTGLPQDPHLPRTAEIYEHEYITALETEPPRISLLESHYNQQETASAVQEENLRFFSAFGLRMNDEQKVDHLRRQLEFVGFLYRMEAVTLARGGEDENVRAIRLARPRYLTRHLLSWLPRAFHAAESVHVTWALNYLKLAEELARAAAR